MTGDLKENEGSALTSGDFTAETEPYRLFAAWFADAGRSEPQVWPQPWRFALLGVLMAQLLLALLVTLI